MKKINLIFALMLSLMGVTQVKADTVTESFDNWGATVAENWSLLGGATYGTTYGYTYIVDSDYAQSGKALYSNQSSNTSTAYIVTPKFAAGTTVSFGFRKKGSSSSTKGYIYFYTYDAETGTVGTTALWNCRPNGINEATSKYQNGSFTVGSSDTQYAILIANAVIDNLVYTPAEDEATEGPAFAAYDGTTKLTSPYFYDFGLTNSNTTKTFTLKNPGTAALGIAVSETGDFNATLSATTIAAGGEVTLTVTMPETTGSSTITVTPDADDIDPFVFNVSGTVKDPNKMFIDFADGNMPEDWENVMIGSYGSGWTINNGYASHSSSSSSYYLAALTSPMVKFTEGEKLYFDVSKYGSSSYSTSMVKVQYSTDGTTWNDVYTTPDAQIVYGTWNTQSVTMPAGTYQIRFYGGYANIDNIYGGELPTVANMKVTAEDHNFGMISEAANTTFTIRNSGRAELTGIEVTSDNSVFTISDAPATLAAGAEATVTVSMNATTKGAQSGVITVTAPEQTTATFNVSGYVLDTDAIIVTFDDNQAPEGWTNNGWTFSNGAATGSYNSSTPNHNSEIVTSAIEVAEGETMAIEAKGNGNYAELYVYTSTDNGTTWTKVGDFNSLMRANTSDYIVAVLSGVAAGNYLLKFEGYSVTVNTINGFHYDQNAPTLTVDPTTVAAFGKVKAQPEAKTYTVTNSGTGTLNVEISSDNAAFTVSEATMELGAGESKTFDIALVFDENYGEKTATITVHPTNSGLSDVTIVASATTADPNVWDEDFESGAIPETWDNEGTWNVTTPTATGNNGTKMATISSYNNPKKLITPRLEAKAGDVLTFDIGMQYDDEPLTIEYSTDNKTTWQVIEEGVASYTASATITFTAPTDGFYYLRFTGTFAMLDNFLGFKEAPLTHDATITTQTIPATGNQFVEYTATVTVKEMAGKAEELTAKFFIGETQCGDDVVETVEANGTKTFTVTFTPDEAASGEAYFTVTNADLTLETEKQAVEIAAAPVLDENGDGDLSSYTNFGNYPAVMLKYSLQAGWNTIVLPFAVSDLSVFGEGAKAYSFAGLTDGAIDFKVETSLNSQQPYVIYATEAKSEIIFLNVRDFRTSSESADICSTKNGATFQGTYAPVEAPNMAGKYGVVPTTGKIAKGGNGASIKGFRAYFELPEGVNGAKVNYRNEDGTITAIKGISILNNGEEGNVYDLNGRKTNASNLPAGVYVKNGKKYVVK